MSAEDPPPREGEHEQRKARGGTHPPPRGWLWLWVGAVTIVIIIVLIVFILPGVTGDPGDAEQSDPPPRPPTQQQVEADGGGADAERLQPQLPGGGATRIESH